MMMQANGYMPERFDMRPQQFLGDLSQGKGYEHWNGGGYGYDEPTPDLATALEATVNFMAPIPEEQHVHSACIHHLQQLARQVGPGWEVKAFGSAANGFLSRGADLDVTCYKGDIQDQDSQMALQELRFRFGPLLGQQPQFQVIQEVWSARVPIIKLRYMDIIDVDLSCHNPQALQNTHLLRSWVEALLHPKEGTNTAPAVSGTPEKRPASSSSRLATNSGQLSAASAAPFVADVCPTSSEELRWTLLRFLSSSARPACPVSAVGLNAALRREHLRAGHPRSALSVFRAADTAAALQAIFQGLKDTNASDALVLDGEGEDLSLLEADSLRIASFHGMTGASQDAKRARREHRPPTTSAVQDFPLATATPVHRMAQGNGNEVSVEELLQAPTARQRQLIDQGDELRQLLAEPTARQSFTAQKFMNKSQSMAQFCAHGSRDDCRAASGFMSACAKIHFRKVIKPWTDESLGDCSYLDTCRHIEKCKYVHYALDLTLEQTRYLQERGVHNRGTDTKRINELVMKGINLPAQWIHCDLRSFPLSIFKGLISVVMADPPWDIHMELPYGTLTDEEVKNLNVGDIHEHGMIFLWVTGRAMELARECFKLWGYKRIEEIVWVKTNQLQRIIRTGRTGHWINHAKEHCLVGIKGNPKLNRNLDCDVIVSEVRETSRKPDEIYNLIERMFPNCPKLELFGRPHNVHENWITCGNQLDGVRLVDDEIVKRYNQEFPSNPTTPFRRAKDELVAYGGGEDAPWVPPSEAPPPSTSEAWVPPQAGWPPPWGWPR